MTSKDYKPKPKLCNVDHTWIGDGECDGILNNEKNCYDGGDCCGEKVDLTSCYFNCNCIDPNHKSPVSDFLWLLWWLKLKSE